MAFQSKMFKSNTLFVVVFNCFFSPTLNKKNCQEIKTMDTLCYSILLH